MKKLYMRKLGLVMLMVGLGFSQVKALTTYPFYSVGNDEDKIDEDAVISGSLTIDSNRALTVEGDLTVGGNITVGNKGVLIVKGNLTISGGTIETTGKIVVVGDFETNSGTKINNNGDLIVGGNLIQNGDLVFGSNNADTRIFVINPDVNPVGIGDAPVGGYEDMLDIVKDIDVIQDVVNNELAVVAGNIENEWTGTVDSDWGKKENWTVMVPGSSAKVVIPKDVTTYPQINKGVIFQVKDLTIKAGAILTLKPGARLTVNGTLTIAEDGGLVMENMAEVNGLASLLTHGEVLGNARVTLEFPRDEWYYVSQPIKNAKSDIYGIWNADGTFNTNEGWVNVHRANRWYRIGGGVDIAQLEGLSIKYRVDDEKDEADHVVTYTGKLNNDMISRPFANRQYYLFGNPYPSALDWQNETGWTRTNIGETIYYRTRINGVMTFVTYNRFNDEGKRAPVIPEGPSEDDLSYIPPLQSVWIASLGDGFVSVDNNARSHVKDGDFLKSSSAGTKSGGAIRVSSVSDGGGDGAVLYFSEKAEAGLDRGDSEKMFNDAVSIPEIYTKVGNKALAINGLPLIEESVRTIPLSVRNRVEGEVTLKFDLSHYDAEHAPYFEDRQTGAFLSLHRSNSYTYSVKETGDNHDRFALHFYKVTTSVEEPQMDEQEAGNEISIKSVSGKVLVSVGMDMLQNGPGVVEVYSIDGRKVSEVPARSGRTLVMLSNQNGVYIVRAKFGNLVKSERVLVSGN